MSFDFIWTHVYRRLAKLVLSGLKSGMHLGLGPYPQWSIVAILYEWKELWFQIVIIFGALLPCFSKIETLLSLQQAIESLLLWQIWDIIKVLASVEEWVLRRCLLISRDVERLEVKVIGRSLMRMVGICYCLFRRAYLDVQCVLTLVYLIVKELRASLSFLDSNVQVLF